MNKEILNRNIKALVATNIEPLNGNDERTFTCIMSYELCDREGEVVLVDGIQLNEFKMISPLLFNHELDEPIGKVLEVAKEGLFIRAKCQIAKNVAKCDEIWELIKQGVLQAVSVGFIPLEIRHPTPLDIQKFGQDVQAVISKCKLLELSVVSVPANQMAMITQVSNKHFKPEVIDNKVEAPAVEETKVIETKVEEVVTPVIEEKKIRKIVNKSINVDLNDISEKQIKEMIKRKVRKEMGYII